MRASVAKQMKLPLLSRLAVTIHRWLSGRCRTILYSLLGVASLFVMLELAHRKLLLLNLNYPLIAAFYLAILFLFLSRNLDVNFRFAIDRLAERNALHFRKAGKTEERGKNFVRAKAMEDRVWSHVRITAETWAVISAAVLFVLAVAPWVKDFWWLKAVAAINDLSNGHKLAAFIRLAHLLCQIVLLSMLSLLIGGRLGKMMYYCWRGAGLDKIKFTFRDCEFVLVFNPQPTHPDSMGGMQPLGDFYAWCATRIFYLLGVLVVTLGVLVIVPWDQRLSVNMSTAIQFAGGFAIFCFLYIGLFLLPLWVIRNKLDAEKKKYMIRCDQMALALSARLERLQGEISMYFNNYVPVDRHRAEGVQGLMDLAAARREYIQAVENMSTWPLSALTWARYALSGLTIVVTVYLSKDRILAIFDELAKNGAPIP